jgi:hypothetical protein
MRYSQKSNSYLRNALTSANLRIPGVFGTWMYVCLTIMAGSGLLENYLEKRSEEGLAVA